MTSNTNIMTTNIDARDLGHAIDQDLPAAGCNPDLPHLMCVLIESKDGSIRFVATDTYRLAIRDVVPSASSDDFRVVVAPETIRNWSDTLDRSGDVTLAADEQTMTVVGEGIELSSPVVPMEFVDYEPILVPSQDLTKAAVDRNELLAAFESLDDNGAVLLSAFGDRLVVQRRKTSLEVAASCRGPEAHVALNPAYAAALRGAVGADAVIEIDQPLRPVVFRSADDGTYTSLLMPVNLEGVR